VEQENLLLFIEVYQKKNSSKIGHDALLDRKSVEHFFEILLDTLVGFLLDPFHRAIRKRQTKKPKFYFFDTGIKRTIDSTLDLPLKPGTFIFGQTFESWIVLELLRLNDYLKRDFRFSYLRTKDDLEVDIIIE